MERGISDLFLQALMEARLQRPRFLWGLAISKSLAIGKSFEDMVVIFLIRYMTTLRASTWGCFATMILDWAVGVEMRNGL